MKICKTVSLSSNFEHIDLEMNGFLLRNSLIMKNNDKSVKHIHWLNLLSKNGDHIAKISTIIQHILFVLAGKKLKIKLQLNVFLRFIK